MVGRAVAQYQTGLSQYSIAAFSAPFIFGNCAVKSALLALMKNGMVSITGEMLLSIGTITCSPSPNEPFDALMRKPMNDASASAV